MRYRIYIGKQLGASRNRYIPYRDLQINGKMKSVLAFQEQQERALLALHGSSSQGYKPAGGFDKITENSVSKTGLKR